MQASFSPSSQNIIMSLTNTPSRQPQANPFLSREELALVTLAGSLPLEAISVYDQVRKLFYHSDEAYLAVPFYLRPDESMASFDSDRATT
jgi:hypothetical protein